MSNLNKRLADLETRTQPAPKVNDRYTDAEHNRSWEALAAALSDTTGEAVTASEAQQAVKELNYELP